jgi:hypothetical protein
MLRNVFMDMFASGKRAGNILYRKCATQPENVLKISCTERAGWCRGYNLPTWIRDVSLMEGLIVVGRWFRDASLMEVLIIVCFVDHDGCEFVLKCVEDTTFRLWMIMKCVGDTTFRIRIDMNDHVCVFIPLGI